MSSDGKRAIRGATGGSAAEEPSAASGARGLGTGWTVFSYLVAGMLAYGAIGWLVGRAVHVGLLFPIGMLVGLAISIGYIIYHFGRHPALTQPPRKEMTDDR